MTRELDLPCFKDLGAYRSSREGSRELIFLKRLSVSFSANFRSFSLPRFNAIVDLPRYFRASAPQLLKGLV